MHLVFCPLQGLDPLQNAMVYNDLNANLNLLDMKKYMLLMIMALAMTACKGTKTAPSANKENNTQSMVNKDDNVKEKDTERSNSEATTNNDSRSQKSDSTGTMANIAGPGGIVSQTNGSTGAMGNARMSTTTSPTIPDMDLEKMYKNLQMTEGQIQTFETSIQKFNESVKYHPNGEMLGTMGDEQERQLKEILSEDQWNKYQVWRNNGDNN